MDKLTAVNFNSIVNNFAASQRVAVAATREAEQMVFPRGDFAQLVRTDFRSVISAPFAIPAGPYDLAEGSR